MMLTGGGTGGHLFPAIATAEEMCARLPGTTILFVGTKRKMDKKSLSHYGYKVKSIYSYGLKGKNVIELIKAVAVLPLSLVQSLYCMLTFRPDVVFGVGGYVTGPVIVAARLLGKKTVIHEQNSVPGLANRKLGSWAGKICISLPESGKFFPDNKTVLTGNPVRKPILDLALESNPEEMEDKPVCILILGGSQGAHRLNELTAAAICDDQRLHNIQVIHQTGVTDCRVVREKYKRHKIAATVEPFFHDMVAVYRQADFLVSRAGATTLAELAVLGKPAILVPFPHAADNHQQKNATYYVEGGGCTVLLEKQLTSHALADEIAGLATDTKKREAMAAAMKKLGMPEAAAKIVDVCIENGSGFLK
jgi:UDP-N-acetylglucosamine--N-acetylmuramyl-(pentapeptide) pyrophosphoryl-undecaprenol N-acetylglucosamine transferase